jgi:hypothetical protein
MTTDYASSFEEHSMIKMVGYDMTKNAAQKVYEAAGVGPDDVDVVELHDCFTANELLTYEGLGLCPEGGAEKFIWDADNTYGGKVVTNPSGGLLSKGHPLGATGLGAVHRAGVAAARSVRAAPGGERAHRAPAQPRVGRRVRGDDVPARLMGMGTGRRRGRSVCWERPRQPAMSALSDAVVKYSFMGRPGTSRKSQCA